MKKEGLPKVAYLEIGTAISVPKVSLIFEGLVLSFLKSGVLLKKPVLVELIKYTFLLNIFNLGFKQKIPNLCIILFLRHFAS